MVDQTEKINVVTLGCAKNLVDSEVLLGHLKYGKARLVDSADDADTVVINTCGFIEAAKQESIDAILEAVHKKQDGSLKKVIVMGCLSERFKAELQQEIPDVDSYFGSNQLQDILAKLGVDYRRELLGERLLTTPSHFVYLKISEGCDNPCSFCAIPLMRGVHKSKPLEQVIAEAHSLASKGVKELIIIAQDSTCYGLDLYGGRKLSSLLGELQAVDGIEWIRLMYAYPAKFPMDVIEAFQRYPKLCRYLDIPVQHAADDVLKSMRRGTTNRGLRELLTTIKDEIPQIALRTTMIVGYPNETEADFQVLCDFVREIEFSRLGVFTYSHEEGTSAYDLGDPIPKEEKERRKNIIMAIQQAISLARNEAFVGSEVRVLIDRIEDGQYVGRTERDAPEIDQEVFVTAKRSLKAGSFISATVTDATEYDLSACLI